MVTVVTTKRPVGGRPPARSGAASGRRTGGKASTTRGRKPPAGKTQARKAPARKAPAGPDLVESAWNVLADHGEDILCLVLVTLGILGALGLWFHALGPAGRTGDEVLGRLLGQARFLVPLSFLAAGVLLIAGRTRLEPARTVLGLFLALVALAGLFDLAGGSPGFHASSGRLAAAGGWTGSLVGHPLRSALATGGAAVVLVAFLALALVLFTGVTLRTAFRATSGAARSLWGLLGPVPESETEVEGRPARTPKTRPVAVEAPVEPEPPVVLAEPEPTPVEPVAVEAPATPRARPRAGRVDQLELDLGPNAGDWRLPPLKLLGRSKPQALDEKEIAASGRSLVEALGAHGVETRLVGYTVGPTVTRFELELGPGVKVARVTSLAKDIAYAMASPDVRILAPIPGKSAIGVEVPNRRRELVTLGDILVTEEARLATHPLEVALGRDIAGRAVMGNMADMPHILISGATGAGKSSCINSVITSILMRATPEEVRLILIDPKRVELGQYNGLPHLLTEVVVDPKKAANALSWAVTEMERRYDLLAEVGMRDITGYNLAVDAGELDGPGQADDGEELVDEDDDLDPEAAARLEARMAEVRAAVEPERRQHQRLPFILVVVDELNDLMMVAARDVEESVCRIAQMARAVGIHLVLATQRPSVDVITGVIKANVPSRLAFSVSSLADSRVILDQPGAERLIGKGDMLLLTASSSIPRRIQGPWVAEEEIRGVVGHWKRQRRADYVEELAAGEGVTPSGSSGRAEDDDDDLLVVAMELVVRSQLGSTSMLQRKLRVGFARAGRLMDLLEMRGVVGPSEGSKARAVLMTPEEFEQIPG